MKVLQGVVAEDSEEDHEALGEAVEEAVEEEDVEVEIEVEDVEDLVAATEPATIATRRVILQENAQNRTNVTDKPRCCTITEKKFPFLLLWILYSLVFYNWSLVVKISFRHRCCYCLS